MVVCGTESSPTPPGELTWALILGLARHVAPEDAAFHAGGPWQSTVGRDLAGATLGLVGLGKIGTRVAGRRAGLRDGGPRLEPAPHRGAGRGRRRASRVLAARRCWPRATGSACTSCSRTRPGASSAAEEIAAMKPSAYLVNTSRAGLVDTDAAGRGARGRPDRRRRPGRVRRGAGARSTTACVPSPNVLATPHLGYVTDGNYRRFFSQAVEDIAAWLAGEPVRVLG